MPSSYTPNLNLELQATGEDSGTWGQNLNNNVFSILDSAYGGTLALPLSNTDVTLSTSQSQNNFINLTGTLLANVNVIFPNIGGTYIVRNATSGAFSVTLKTVAAGASVSIPQGSVIVASLTNGDVYSDQLGFVPVQQGGGPNQGTNKINIGWGGTKLYVSVDGNGFLGLWPIDIGGSAYSVGGVTNPTAKNSVVAYQSNTVEFGSVGIDGNNTWDLPSPYVMTGLRSSSSPGLYGVIYLRGRVLMTQ